MARLSLGSTLNSSNLKEGDDVYFECHVRAKPPPKHIRWTHDVSLHFRNKKCRIKSELFLLDSRRNKGFGPRPTTIRYGTNFRIFFDDLLRGPRVNVGIGMAVVHGNSAAARLLFRP